LRLSNRQPTIPIGNPHSQSSIAIHEICNRKPAIANVSVRSAAVQELRDSTRSLLERGEDAADL